MPRCLLFWTLMLLMPSASVGGWLAPAPGQPGSPTAGTVAPQVLEKRMAERRARFPEFVQMKAIAERFGVELWLWGGTAAAFLHDTRWHLLAEAHPEQFRRGRLRDELDAVFRSQQDFDLATNGSRAVAHQIAEALSAAMPGLKFEVRSLHEADGDKDALLSDDVLKQHSDTGTRGMVRLTEGPDVVSDLPSMRFGPGAAEFLRDGAAATLQYVFSDQHETTRPFREGRNPETLSIVRALIKACAFDLRIPEASWAKMKAGALRSPIARIPPGRARDWLSRQGRKVVMHALDMRLGFAWLRELQLLDDLRALDGTWFSRQPLETLPPTTKPTPITAGSEQLARVTHDTVDIEAFEAITWDPAGRPNFAVTDGQGSRRGVFFGRGDVGGKKTGLDITLDVDPKAVLGHDIHVGTGELILHNRDSVRLRPVVETEPLEHWLDERAFFQLRERGYAMARLHRRILNHLETVPAPLRGKAFRQFVERFQFEFPTRSLTDNHHAEYLLFLYDVAQPESRRYVERQLKAQGTVTATDWWMHVAFASNSASLMARAKEVAREQFDSYLGALAADQIDLSRIRYWCTSVALGLRLHPRHGEFLQEMVRSTARWSLRLPPTSFGDRDVHELIRYPGEQLDVVDTTLFSSVPAGELPARLRGRMFFSHLREGFYTSPPTKAALAAITPLDLVPVFDAADDAALQHALAWLLRIPVEMLIPSLPLIRENPVLALRLASSLPTEGNPTSGIDSYVSTLVETPGVSTVTEQSWVQVSELLDRWLNVTPAAYREYLGDRFEARLRRWIERLTWDSPRTVHALIRPRVETWHGRFRRYVQGGWGFEFLKAKWDCGQALTGAETQFQ